MAHRLSRTSRARALRNVRVGQRPFKFHKPKPNVPPPSTLCPWGTRWNNQAQQCVAAFKQPMLPKVTRV